MAWRIWAERGCAPLVLEGKRLAAVRARLRRRALALGHAVTRVPSLTLLAAGRSMRGRAEGSWRRFPLPPRTREVRLLSRVWVPAEMDAAPGDPRRLGIAIAALRLDGASLALDDPRLAAGWHDPEPAWRWTAGEAAVAVAGARVLDLRLAMTGRYWRGGGPAGGRRGAIC
jgi:hypothetical protein